MTLMKLSQDARNHFLQQGYLIVPQLVPSDLLDTLLRLYQQDVVTAKHPFLRQSTYTYEPHQFTEQGYVQQSFLDIHDYQRHPDFSQAARDIFCSPEIIETLKQISGQPDFHLMQGMLFDANTETAAHQEWWYLDSIPHGHLIIIWIALEDIDEKAGRFYVLPRTEDNLDFHTTLPSFSHDLWLERIKTYVNTHPELVDAPALKKGDVLFFDSRVIHGSLPTQDPQFSRKSLTAHYLPSPYKFGNLFKEKSVQYKVYNGVKYYKAHPEYSQWNQLKFATKKAAYQIPVLPKVWSWLKYSLLRS